MKLTPREEHLAEMVNANLVRRRQEERAKLFQTIGPVVSPRVIGMLITGAFIALYILLGAGRMGGAITLLLAVMMLLTVFYEIRCHLLRRDLRRAQERVDQLESERGATEPVANPDRPALGGPVYYASSRRKE